MASGRQRAASAATSGSRFGRASSAKPAAAPAATGAPGSDESASSSASVHHATAGTSLMGCTSWNRKMGLVASSNAAVRPGASRMQPRAKEVGAEHGEAAKQRHHEERRPFAANRPRRRHRQRQSWRVGGHHFAGRWTRAVTERREGPRRVGPWQQPGQRLVEGHARGGQKPRLAHVPRGVGGGGGERAEADARARGGRRDHDRDGRSMAIEAGARGSPAHRRRPAVRQPTTAAVHAVVRMRSGAAGRRDEKWKRSGVDDETAGDEDNDQHEQGARAEQHEEENDATGGPGGDAHSPSAASAAASTLPSSTCRTPIGRSRSSCRRR